MSLHRVLPAITMESIKFEALALPNLIRFLEYALSLLLVCGGTCNSQSLLDEGCSVQGFEAQPATTVNVCTSILDAGGLSHSARAEALKIRARSLHSLGRLDEAISDYESALLLAPDDPELHVRRGWTAYDRHEFERVFGEAERALQLKPGYASAHDLIGAVFAHSTIRKFQAARAA
jgi:tetratricopeptide (TPR) repeat protein